ncbi:MAG: GNAT family N-acetyltransferase [bacterium]
MHPFQSQEYRGLFVRHFIPNTSQLVEDFFELLSDKRAVFIGMKPVLNGQELTDFGDIPSPSKERVKEYCDNLKKMHGATSVQFDYVREDSPLFQILSHISSAAPLQQAVSPFIMLPNSWEQYLKSLERTDRKELKRKLKRLGSVPYAVQYADRTNLNAFEEFVKLHRLSDVSKKQFMSEKMKSFFYDLYTLPIPSWHTKLAFLEIEHTPAAVVYYFENDEELLLYNSGYDPGYKQYSAGFLLFAYLIKDAIANGKKRLDFLRGNERYKYDLGGKDRKLYQFIIT